MNPNAILESDEDEKECHICYKTFNLTDVVPIVLNCNHTVCYNCANTWWERREEKVYECPMCRTPTKSEGKDIFFYRDGVELVERSRPADIDSVVKCYSANVVGSRSLSQLDHICVTRHYNGTNREWSEWVEERNVENGCVRVVENDTGYGLADVHVNPGKESYAISSIRNVVVVRRIGIGETNRIDFSSLKTKKNKRTPGLSQCYWIEQNRLLVMPLSDQFNKFFSIDIRSNAFSTISTEKRSFSLVSKLDNEHVWISDKNFVAIMDLRSTEKMITRKVSASINKPAYVLRSIENKNNEAICCVKESVGRRGSGIYSLSPPPYGTTLNTKNVCFVPSPTLDSVYPYGCCKNGMNVYVYPTPNRDTIEIEMESESFMWNAYKHRFKPDANAGKVIDTHISDIGGNICVSVLYENRLELYRTPW